MAIYDKKDCTTLVIHRHYYRACFKTVGTKTKRPTNLNIEHKNLTREQARDFADKLERFKHVFRVQVFVKSGGFI